MFDKWREAGQSAMEGWQAALDEFKQPTAPVDAVMERYLREHRGNWSATLTFAAQNVGQDKAAEEAQRYTDEMERRLEEQGGGRRQGGWP